MGIQGIGNLISGSVTAGLSKSSNDAALGVRKEFMENDNTLSFISDSYTKVDTLQNGYKHQFEASDKFMQNATVLAKNAQDTKVQREKQMYDYDSTTRQNDESYLLGNKQADQTYSLGSMSEHTKSSIPQSENRQRDEQTRKSKLENNAFAQLFGGSMDGATVKKSTQYRGPENIPSHMRDTSGRQSRTS